MSTVSVMVQVVSCLGWRHSTLWSGELHGDTNSSYPVPTEVSRPNPQEILPITVNIHLMNMYR